MIKIISKSERMVKDEVNSIGEETVDDVKLNEDEGYENNTGPAHETNEINEAIGVKAETEFEQEWHDRSRSHDPWQTSMNHPGQSSKNPEFKRVWHIGPRRNEPWPIQMTKHCPSFSEIALVVEANDDDSFDTSIRVHPPTPDKLEEVAEHWCNRATENEQLDNELESLDHKSSRLRYNKVNGTEPGSLDQNSSRLIETRSLELSSSRLETSEQNKYAKSLEAEN